jgi:hypothetical protein
MDLLTIEKVKIHSSLYVFACFMFVFAAYTLPDEKSPSAFILLLFFINND